MLRQIRSLSTILQAFPDGQSAIDHLRARIPLARRTAPIAPYCGSARSCTPRTNQPTGADDGRRAVFGQGGTVRG